MINIKISDTLAERLSKLADREKRSLDEVVETILETHIVAEEEMEAPPGSGAAFIRAALAANIHTGERDVAAKSREILDQDFPAALKSQSDKMGKQKPPDRT